MNDVMYCYPDSEVLRNKLGIDDQEKLQEIERKLTAPHHLGKRLDMVFFLLELFYDLTLFPTCYNRNGWE